jgi:tol-pal system protein YbgF
MRRVLRVLAGVLAVAVAGCAITPAEDDPVQVRLNDLDNRLTRIEKMMANQNLVEIANDLESMRTEIRSMRNETDQIGQSAEATRKQQRDLYTDLDQRLKSLEAHGAVVPAEGAPATLAQSGNPGDDKASYQAAFELLKASKYQPSIDAFQRFIVSYPESSLIDNANYWLGEAYYVNKAFPDALRAFRGVIEKYPSSRKYPDALLKTGFCYYELKQWSAAKERLQKVTAQFADTAAGRLAQQRLEKMASEGH